MKRQIVFIVIISISAVITTTAQVKYTSDGKLGIGTTSPSSTLNVHGSTPFLEISNTSETASGILFYDHGYESTQYGKILYHSGSEDAPQKMNSLNFYMNQTTPYISLYKDIYGGKHIDFYENISIHNDHWTGGLRCVVLDPTDGGGGANMATLYPSSTWYGSLGTVDEEFGFGYISHVFYDVITQNSDERLKENIRELDTGLDAIISLRPVYFDYAKSYYDSIPEEARTKLKESGKDKIGFIAQEVQEVIPGLVSEASGDGYLGVNVTEMIPLLVKAIQEQQTQIEYLKEQISVSPKSVTSVYPFDEIPDATLSQNIPNPFSEETRIGYNIPEINSQANINIYDLQGKQIQTYSIHSEGQGEILIPGSELNPGMYIYNLIVDGKEVDSKRMILTD